MSNRVQRELYIVNNFRIRKLRNSPLNNNVISKSPYLQCVEGNNLDKCSQSAPRCFLLIRRIVKHIACKRFLKAVYRLIFQ